MCYTLKYTSTTYITCVLILSLNHNATHFLNSSTCLFWIAEQLSFMLAIQMHSQLPVHAEIWPESRPYPTRFVGLYHKGKSIVMHQQKLSGKSWLKICSLRWDCSPPPQSRKLDWICKENITEYSHTLILRSDEVLCWSCSVSTAQGGTAVNPPPPKFSFFSLRKSTAKKNFVTSKVRLLAPKPTHLVYNFSTSWINLFHYKSLCKFRNVCHKLTVKVISYAWNSIINS